MIVVLLLPPNLERWFEFVLFTQGAQHDLARSAVKAMSLKHGRDAERARHINAIYTEIALNDVRQKEAENQTEKERMETVLKDATRDMVRCKSSSVPFKRVR